MNKIITAALILLLAACTPKKEEQSTKETTAKTEVSNELNNKTAIEDYMALKDALVQTDASLAKDAANEFVESAGKEVLPKAIIEAAKVVASTQDVEEQRTAFKTVTDQLIVYYKADNSENGLFVQYCPMAFGNTGASWLSSSEEIMNPYFGDKMLKCGRVTEEL